MDISKRLRNYIKDTIPKDIIDFIPNEAFCLDVFDLLIIEDDKYIVDLYNSKKLDTYELAFLMVSLLNARRKATAVSIYSEILNKNNQALSSIALECLYKLNTKKAKKVLEWVATYTKDDLLREIADYYLRS